MKTKDNKEINKKWIEITLLKEKCCYGIKGFIKLKRIISKYLNVNKSRGNNLQNIL